MNQTNSPFQTFIQRLHDYRNARNWTNLSSSDLAKSIVIEAAELLEPYQWENFKPKAINKSEIAGEAADIFIYLLQFCMENDIDLIQAANQKLDKVESKYPADKVKGNQEEYYSRKQNHRLQNN